MKRILDIETKNLIQCDYASFRARIVCVWEVIKKLPPGRERPQLLYVSDWNNASRNCILEIRNSFVVGRGLDCDWPFPEDESMSLKHFRIVLDPANGVFLVDLKSRNGVIVNGLLIELRRLVHGDLIQSGNEFFIFLDEGL